MDLPTYTNIWRIEKRLYKLYDFRLPMPLPVGTFGVALGVFALWVVLLSLVRAPFEFGNGWHLVLWVVPPGVITVLATRPVIEGKRLTELLISQARFLTEARVYTRMAPEYEPARIRVAVRVWHRDPDAGPLPLPRGARRARVEEESARSVVSEAAVAEVPVPEVSEEEQALRAAREAAPPLRGVAAPEPAPASATEPAPAPAAEPEREPVTATAEEPETEFDPDDAVEYIPARRVPVSVGAETARSAEQETAEVESAPSALASVPPSGRDEEEGRPRPRVGRRMLNYFGFALPAGEGGEATSVEERGDARLGDAGDGFDEPLHATEEDEQRDRDAWFARLKASSGETPVGLTAKSASTSSDTGAMSSAELADAVDRDAETTASRRLRGRVQGIQVARDLAGRRERGVEPTDVTEDTRVTDAPERAREDAPERARENAPERARERVRPPAESPRAQGRALPATGREQAPPRRKGRPHASPWELDKPANRNDYPDLSDYAARFAEATGRPSPVGEVASAPWSPPASAAPEKSGGTQEGAEGRESVESALPSGGVETPENTASTASVETPEREVPAGTSPSAEAAEAALPVRTPGSDVRGGSDGPHEGAGTTEAEAPAPAEGTAPEGSPGPAEHAAAVRAPEDTEIATPAEQAAPTATEDSGVPVAAAEPVRADARTTEVEDGDAVAADGSDVSGKDVGTAEHGAPTVDEPAGEDGGDAERIGRTEAGPQRSHAARPLPRGVELDHGTGEQSDHMSVLDRHLIQADTPAPPRPKFADAVPTVERSPEAGDPSDWFDDGKRRHPDQPKIGDKDNPVIPVSELREERRRREREQDDARRAAEEAAETRSEPAKPATQLDHGTGELVSFVEVREEPTARPAGGSEATPKRAAPEPDAVRRTESELSEAEEAALSARRRGPGKDTAGETSTDAPAEPSTAHDPHDGVFHRVAHNARRIGQLFGQPVPGEEPEPPAARPAPPAQAPAPEPEPEPEPAKPGLELDHGTGEQVRLTEPAPATEVASVDSGGTRGWRRLAKVVTGGTAPVRSDLPPADIERLRAPMAGPRSLVVLGCTGGAGQTVTALMVGHTLAEHRDDRVVAVDVNPGPNGLSRRVGAQAPETLTALLANADAIDEYERMRAYAGRARTGLEVVQTLDDPYVQTLDDRDYGQLADLLGSFYGISLLDPAATGVARALPVADGLVLVAPASADAERAVSMTFEWLDGNGYAALRANAVLVVNGVSKRSLPDVDAAERVARGRCRAIVRIPWDDHLGASYTKIDVGALKPATKRAHGALAGVLVNALEPAPQH
ncbi:TcpE family conjugal transfer membrane protein [Nocardiopsis sp. MG754419]|uniref:TcpE family conjugal transfer membrane protein n=1 Tax=Nocardiopsis sp. MG754419 TaxID=2259865 RepID=UPI001BA8D4FE|nr:TcpE family conjugal transfer membrane protein [Nocardiopsis sp. MG754419]MBR8742979.1 hypothetical protein [Nocardiopsis sp. MG754419]